MNLDVITVGEKSTADIVLIWFHGYGANNWGFEPFIKLLNLNLDGRLHVVMPNAPIDDGKRSWYPLPTTDNGSVVEDDEGIMNSKKILVGLASNAIRKNVTLTLNELGVHDLFDSIICGDEVNFGKPNPEMFDKTVSRFKLKKDNCIIFEDSIEGVGAAVNAGINVIGVTSSSSGDVLNNAGCIKSISNYQKFDLSILE